MNFALGIYGDFIWPAYALSALGLAAAILLTWWGWCRAKARLAALEKNRP